MKYMYKLLNTERPNAVVLNINTNMREWGVNKNARFYNWCVEAEASLVLPRHCECQFSRRYFGSALILI